MFSCKLWRSILAFYFKMIGINKSKKYYIFIENVLKLIVKENLETHKANQ